jgi:hypothetical protein
MFSCDPVLLVLFVVLIIFLALIVRELAVRNGYLEGPKLFDGAYDGASVMSMTGGNCGACGGADDDLTDGLTDELDITGMLDK